VGNVKTGSSPRRRRQCPHALTGGGTLGVTSTHPSLLPCQSGGTLNLIGWNTGGGWGLLKKKKQVESRESQTFLSSTNMGSSKANRWARKWWTSGFGECKPVKKEKTATGRLLPGKWWGGGTFVRESRVSSNFCGKCLGGPKKVTWGRPG